MKYIIGLFVICITLFISSCERITLKDKLEKIPITSVFNYKNGQIVDKRDTIGVYFMDVRYGNEGIYYVKTIRVPLYEYNNYNLGDTIKYN